MDSGGMARIGEQSAGEVLCADRGWQEVFEARRSELGSAVCGHRAGSGKGMSNQEVRDALGEEDAVAGAVAVPHGPDEGGTERGVAVSPGA